jgi:antitoxin component of MazEF toxin-antitoxin module
MITREMIVDMLMAHDFVAITFAKVNGDVTTRIATIKRRPDVEAPKGVRETNPDNFRFYEWGRENRFDPSAPGDWASCKVANVKDIRPATVE